MMKRAQEDIFPFLFLEQKVRVVERGNDELERLL